MTEIILQYNKADFEELYFSNGRGNILFYRERREISLFVILSACLFILSLTYSLINNRGWVIFCILFAVVLIMVPRFVKIITPAIKWKRAVIRHLDRLSQFKIFKIILSESSFTLIEDNNETIEPCNFIKKVELNNISIAVTANNFYYFPRKSMSAEDYQLFKTWIKDKLCNKINIVEDNKNY